MLFFSFNSKRSPSSKIPPLTLGFASYREPFRNLVRDRSSVRVPHASPRARGANRRARGAGVPRLPHRWFPSSRWCSRWRRWSRWWPRTVGRVATSPPIAAYAISDGTSGGRPPPPPASFVPSESRVPAGRCTTPCWGWSRHHSTATPAPESNRTFHDRVDERRGSRIEFCVYSADEFRFKSPRDKVVLKFISQDTPSSWLLSPLFSVRENSICWKIEGSDDLSLKNQYVNSVSVNFADRRDFGITPLCTR